MSTTIRVSEGARARLAALAQAMGRPMTDVVEDAVDALERRVFFDEMNTGYNRLRADKAAWRSIARERAVEEGAALDRSR